MDDTQGNQRNATKAEMNTDKNIAHLEKLLDQSVMGFHHLFDNQRIAEIMKTPTEKIDFFTSDNMKLIQILFDRLILKTTVEEKRAYIESLNSKDFEVLLRTYFHLVESTMISNEQIKH